MNWTAVALFGLAIGSLLCAGVGIWISIQVRSYHLEALAAIEGVGEANKLWFNICMFEIDKLKAHAGIKLTPDWIRPPGERSPPRF
jgi:hypothetical protein